MSPNNITVPARRLNALGMARFSEWLDTKDSDSKTSVAAPADLYYNADTSEAVEGVGALPHTVTNKMEMAQAINAALGSKRAALIYDEGFWTALTLLYVDAVIPAFNGKRHIYGKSIYIMPSYDELRDTGKGYRHRVWGVCYTEFRFGFHARAFFSGDISRLADGLDALIYYNQAYQSVVQAVDALYMTVDGEFAGDGNKLNEEQKALNLRGGQIRDFIEHCRQIGYTHSLAHVSPEVLIASANKVEFQPQLENCRIRREAGDLPWIKNDAVRAAA